MPAIFFKKAENVRKFDFPEKIEAFNPKQQVYFYELFVHFLTVPLRGGLFTEWFSDSERAKWLTGIAHRITYKIFVMGKNAYAK